MKERIAIYPFTRELSSFILYKDQLKNYELVFAITPRGWDKFEDQKDRFAKIVLDEDTFYLNQCINYVDVLLLCKPILNVDLSLYENIIKLAKINGVKVVYVEELEALLINRIQNNWECLKSHEIVEVKRQEQSSIEVPVISVIGIGENCEKWDVQLGLRDFFLKKGYKVSLISNNKLLKLFGASIFPPVINSTEYKFEQQVGAINSYIKKVELMDSPDLIIIGVPGGIMRYNRYVHNGFGYAPFLVSNAFIPDITVVSLYCGYYEKEQLEEIKRTCLYKLGVNANYFHISSKVSQYNLESKQIDYFSIDQNYVNELVEKNSINGAFFNINKEPKEVFQRILEELHHNIPVM
ncbi:TIGR04066 family peptide maturation system protein [Paenibacillus sp. CAA11]|uniref:TIGR04066 family peptide maturation system protein n=1 Tax=Paenibacillus sp. CAA11 TaxID=1532905 RepID=UPI000D39446B|nr:TIGR04066 family peptide maturation system protein [Paenibacillus sp. CAA11]AWB42986.1 TIGR04066 family peptide maturation system protein [Paenibacillus sp. CAA11]